MIGVEKESIKCFVKSGRLKPAVIGGGSTKPNQIIAPGKTFEMIKDVENRGEKVARNLEMFFVGGGHFVLAEKTPCKYKRAALGPGESWEVVFKIRVKKCVRPGIYPLLLACTARNADRSDTLWEIEVQGQGEDPN